MPNSRQRNQKSLFRLLKHSPRTLTNKNLNKNWNTMALKILTDSELEQIYRPSSTLIIVAKSNLHEQGYNYRLLLVKRSASTAFAPDHHVFPGGVFDVKADSSKEWLEYLKAFGVFKEDLDKLSLMHLPNRPKPLMTNHVNLSRDISLRITAIREAFEEVGILLCISHDGLRNSKVSENYLHNFDRLHWQRKVHNNAMEFLNLCKHLNVVPDLWSLHEWSIWRSPSTALKKYDTVIYAVTLTEQPELLLEPEEIENELWSTPISSLKLYSNHSIWLAAMQFYEISRLGNCFDWTELSAFIKRRNSKGSTLIMPTYFGCKDFLVGVLPGDDFYPGRTLEQKETIKLDLTEAEFKAKTKKMHRITYYNMYSLSISLNIVPIDDHFSPLLHLFAKSKM